MRSEAFVPIGLVAIVLVTSVACDPPAETRAPMVASSASSPPRAPKRPSAARPIAPGQPLEEGVVSWEGMVIPTKGGFNVRGVTLEEADLRRGLAESAIDGLPADPDWFLGAVVRVTARLTELKAAAPPAASGEIMQMRAGGGMVASEIDSVELVKPAASIEGTLDRSKGLYLVDGHLVSHEDIAWSLGTSGKGVVPDGARVRLWGQPRVVTCRPGDQCLDTGSLPLFDVGRAKRL